MARAFSTLLGRGSLPAGSNVGIFTVIPGSIVVVRSVDVVCQDALGGSFFLEDAGSIAWLELGPAGVLKGLQWSGRQVYDAGDTVHVAALTSSWWYSVSGYLLSV